MNKKWLAAALGAPLAAIALVAAFPRTQPRPAVAVGDAERRAIVEALAARLQEHYVFADTGARLAGQLRMWERHGDYVRHTDGAALARALNTDMAGVARDLNLAVSCGAAKPAASSWLDALPGRSTGAGVKAVELLPAAIGYIELSEFAPPALAAPRYAAALEKLAGAADIVLDLRQATGDSRAAARLLASYFVDRRLHLYDIHFRSPARAEQQWTVDRLGAPRFLGKLHVLVGPGTGPAAEDFAYAMQAMKRGPIAGERTPGAANIARAYRLSAHCVATIPVARPVSPLTQANWEGTGVAPDMPANGIDAWRMVHVAILRDRLAHATNKMGSYALVKMLGELETDNHKNPKGPRHVQD